MNRLQKKCVTGSLILHGSIVLLLIVGPGFFKKQEKWDAIIPAASLLDLSKATLTDNFTGGGGVPNPVPNADPGPKPAEQPQQPQPKPVEQPQPRPAEPPREVVKPAPRETVQPPVREFKPVRNNTVDPFAEKTKPEKPDRFANLRDPKKLVPAGKAREEAAQRAAEGARARAAALADRLAKLEESIGNGGGGPVGTGGAGTGGALSLAYADYVKLAYEQAWFKPAEAGTKKVVRVKVTIRRDGKVTDFRIESRSGDRTMDKSIEDLRHAVPSLRPFPPAMKDSEKTFNINFELEPEKMG